MPRLTIPVRLRWSDIDAYRHVNNAQMFTILEECRIAAFWASVPGDPASTARGEATPSGTAPTASPAPGTEAAAREGGETPDGTIGTKVLATGPGSGTNTYIARQEIEYLAPVPYSLEPLQVQMWISHLGGASIDVCYEVPGPDGPAARAMTTLVLIDENTGRPRRITAEEKTVWSRFMDDAIRFRRRDSGVPAAVRDEGDRDG